MNKIKKALLLALSLAMSATLFAACKDKNNGGSTSSSDVSSEVSTPVEDSSVEDSSVEDSSVEDSSVTDNSVEDGSVEDSSVEDGSVEDSSVEDSSVEDSSVEDSSVEVSSVEDSSVEDSSVEDSSVEDSSVEDSSVEDSSVEDSSVEDSSVEDSSVEDSSVEDSSEEESTPVEDSSSEDGSSDVEDSSSEDGGDEEEDLADQIKFWDRLNKNILNGKQLGVVQENTHNYYDGSESSVKVEVQSGVTNGSETATKLSFNVNNLTEEEYNACSTQQGSWWTTQMWVGFAIPVGGMDLTKYEITFDAKFDNMNTTLIVYAARDYEGDLDAVYETDNQKTIKGSDAEDLGNGWFRYTFTVDCSWDVGTSADYIILSLDNTATGINTDNDSIVYIDNLSMKEVNYYTVTLDVDGEQTEVSVRDDVAYFPEAPSKEFFEFAGWVDANGNPVDEPFMVTGDITLTATWEKLPVVAQVNKAVSVDLNLTEEGYDLATFSAGAGTYDVIMSGGIRAVELNADGTLPENEDDYVEITQFVFTEDTTVMFAIVYGWDDADIYMTGTISITCDYTEGLIKSTIEKQMIKDGYAATAPERAFQNGSTATVVTEGIPEGYESMLRLDWYQESTSLWKAGGNPLYRTLFNQTNIEIYDVVRFGMKLETNGDAYVAANNKAVNLGANQWLFFELHQTSANVWDLVVKDENNAILYSVFDIVRDGGSAAGFGNVDVDSVATLVFSRTGYNGAQGGNAWASTHMIALYPCSDASMTASIYTTEIIGWRENIPFDPAISEDAQILWNHAWNNYYFTGGGQVEGKYSEEAAPEGYSYVSEYSFTGNDFPRTGHLNDSDVSAYSDLYFAMKIENGSDIYVQGAQFYTGGDWLYIHLHQEENGRWTKTLRAADGYEATQTNLTGYQYTVNAAEGTFTIVKEYPTLFGLLSYTYSNIVGCGHTGSYPRGNGSTESTAYFTNVLAIRKDGAAITPPAAPGETPDTPVVPDEPWAPEISDDAVIITDAMAAVGGANAGFATVDTTETAPAGFDSVTAFKSEGKTWSSYILTTGDLSAVDVQNYSELWFAVKMVNGKMTETPSFADVDSFTDNSWVYFHLIQQENTMTDTSGNPTIAWTIEITKADGTVWKTITDQHANASNTIGRILDMNVDNSRIVFYQDRNNLGEPTYLYSTEVVGVAKEVEEEPEVPVEPEEPFTPGISVDAIKVRDSIWRASGYALSSSTDMEAPEGFTIVKEYKWNYNTTLVTVNGFENQIPWGSNNKDMSLTCFDEADVSAYTEVWFAMKNVGGTGFYVRNASKYEGSDWLYFHLVKVDGAWTLSLSSPDGYVAENVQTGIVGNTLQKILQYHEKTEAEPWDSGAYPTKADGDYTTDVRVYLTDMWAVCEPYSPTIPAEATEIAEDIWREDRYGLSDTTTMAAPEGFSKVTEFDFLHNPKNWSTASTTNPMHVLDTETDLSGYSDIYFAIKLVNGTYVYINGLGADGWYYGTDWLYVHYHQNADESWTLSLGTTAFVKDNVQTVDKATWSAQHEDYATIKGLMTNKLYACRAADAETVFYMTEVLGVAKA